MQRTRLSGIALLVLITIAAQAVPSVRHAESTLESSAQSAPPSMPRAYSAPTYTP